MGDFIPYDIMLSPGKEGGRVDINGYGVCLPRQQVHVLRRCCPGSVWTSACQ